LPPEQDAAAFIRTHTVIGASVLQPGLKLYLASEITPLWLATEAFLRAHNMAPPFWAFAWPGGEALAHYIAGYPELVRGKRVLDFAAGGGIAALACARAGAAFVEAAEIDPLAVAAMRLNAEANQLTIHPLLGDVVGSPCRWDIILCGDVCYEAPMTRHIMPWLQGCATQIPVIMADPGRGYSPRHGFEIIDEIMVPTSLELEDSASRLVRLLRLVPAKPEASSQEH
jgi:predicted nicotinamide N-methyase